MTRRPYRRPSPTATRKIAMNSVTHDGREEDRGRAADGSRDEQLPRRPRRQYFNRRTAALAALITCAIGFYAGVRIEKGQLASSTTLGTAGTSGTGAARARARAGGLAALFGGAGALGATGASGATGGAGASGATGGAGATGASGASGASGAGRSAGGAGAGGGGASFGTVASVNGSTIDVTDTSGNTVKVQLSSATKISKTESVKRSAVRPGDTVVILGVTKANGTISAATVTDSGAGRTGGSSSSSTSGTSGSSGSGVNSLFSSGG
jgi:hypothetical protein